MKLKCGVLYSGYEGLYEASDFGRIKSLKHGKEKILTPSIASGDYLKVKLYKKGEQKQILVHRLVIEAFYGLIPKGLEVNHRNEKKEDNRLENLELLTRRENLNYGTRTLRAAQTISKELKLTNVINGGKYTFANSYLASKFFGYKFKTTIGKLIHHARKKNLNKIFIRGEWYYFQQES